MSTRVAFFDVDQTLVSHATIFRFLAFDVAARGLSRETYDEVIDGLRRVKATGASRAETNRAFYRTFAGRSVDELEVRGERWFRAEHARGDLFDPRLLTLLRAHAMAGDLTVLLSGSFPPCLVPIARFVAADVVICTRPEIQDGRYTGQVEVPMVGAHKADAASALARERGVALGDCFAYGDDVSDLSMLMLVGHPVVVGDDAVLNDRAVERGWRRIPPGWSRTDTSVPPTSR